MKHSLQPLAPIAGQLLETIQVADGRFLNLPAHLTRMRQSAHELYGEWREPGLTPADIPADRRTGVVKCRIVYDTCVRDLSFQPYAPRTVRSLRLVQAPPDLDYHLKYADRSPLMRLLEQRQGCDDILIVRDGFLTDTSYSNIAFDDGSALYLPRTCLLNGCKRRLLLDSGRARAVSLTPHDIRNFRTAHLINALLDPGQVVVDTGCIMSS